MDCALQQLPNGKWWCRDCDEDKKRLLPDRARRNCWANINKRGRPGTELHRILGWVHTKPTKDCNCAARAAEMDRNGPDWCEANIDTIIGWMREEAEKRELPFVRAGAALLVKWAIRRARRKARKHKEKKP